VTSISARRRHPAATFVVLLLALGVTGGIYAALAPRDASAASGSSMASTDEGRRLFLTNCSSCHGVNGEGTSNGPPLIGVGAAAVDFQVGTGRMPAAQLGAQVPQKRPEFTDEQTAAMAAFVGSLGPGPSVPDRPAYDTNGANIARGSEIYKTNCSMCHNFAGSGGALTHGQYAPALRGVPPKYVYEAMVTGPQEMPVFSDNTLAPDAKRDVIAFLQNANTEPNPGGAPLGKLGPVTEGLVGWFVGIGALIGCAVWLGAKAR
jgi:ubiquinol-cytochrome c reductase cytochrome c subunit